MPNESDARPSTRHGIHVRHESTGRARRDGGVAGAYLAQRESTPHGRSQQQASSSDSGQGYVNERSHASTRRPRLEDVDLGNAEKNVHRHAAQAAVDCDRLENDATSADAAASPLRDDHGSIGRHESAQHSISAALEL